MTKILIVEPNAERMDYVASAAKNSFPQASIVSVSTPSEAQEKIAQVFDVAFIDLAKDGEEKLRLVSALKENNPDIRIIGSMNEKNQGLAIEATRAGISSLLTTDMGENWVLALEKALNSNNMHKNPRINPSSSRIGTAL